MKDPGNEPDEPEWWPAKATRDYSHNYDHTLVSEDAEWSPPPPPDTWGRWTPRVLQVLGLHALAGATGGLYWAGRISSKTAGSLLLSQSLILVLAWIGFVTYIVVRARERSGARADGGRFLVTGLDISAAVATVPSICLWIALLVGLH